MAQAVAITKNTAELERLEGIIRRNLQSFYEVGRALMEIRDSGLYRDVLGHETFEAYCRERWDFARRTAYQFIDSVKVIDNVRHGAQIPAPANERQTRPLARLEPDQQREAWAKAVETAPDGKITAAHVQKIVRGMVEPEKPKVVPKRNAPIMPQEPISPEFKAAFDAMVVEIKNARAMKWRETSQKGAIELMQILLDIAKL